MTITVGEAQDRLPELIQAIKEGGQVTLTEDGNAVAELVPAKTRLEPRRFGTMKGRIKILDLDRHRPQNDIESWLQGDV
jgi:antitoxin (DNA-binding transcriptional repressor) of toxin-antitoxin stability system